MRYQSTISLILVLTCSALAAGEEKEKSPYSVLYELIDKSTGEFESDFDSAILARRAAADHVATLARNGRYIIIASRDPDDPWIKTKASLKAKNILVADELPNFDYAKDYVEAFNATSYPIVKAKFAIDLPKPSGKPRFGKHIIYIVDASATTLDMLEFITLELKRSISMLSHQQSYLMIIYQGDRVFTAEPGEMAAATSQNKQTSFIWLEEGHVVPHGASDPSAALSAAYASDPALIFWLTDGLDTGRNQIDHAKLISHVKTLHEKHGTKLNTILFRNTRGEKTIETCAKITGGLHKMVSARELAIEPDKE